MAMQWVNFDTAPRTLELSKGKIVQLYRYKRPRKKHRLKKMDPELTQFFGKIGEIVEVNLDEQDEDGFQLVWVLLKNAKGEEVKIRWRFVSLKKMKQNGI